MRTPLFATVNDIGGPELTGAGLSWTPSASCPELRGTIITWIESPTTDAPALATGYDELGVGSFHDGHPCPSMALEENPMRFKILAVMACAMLAAVAFATNGMAISPNKTVVVYDDFSSGTNSKWSNPYGPGETAINDVNHRETFPNGTERVRAVPFQ